MKKNYSRLAALIIATFLLCISAEAQTDKQRQKITSSYNMKAIDAIKQQFAIDANIQKAKALEAAKKHGWPVYKKNSDGTYDELMGLFPDGKPMYYSLDNANAAKSTRAIHLNSGGSLGLSLDGQNMYSGVWDGGAVRTTHQEFNGRVAVTDGVTALSDNSFHATHVTGTVCATGVQAAAKGMAPLSTVRSFDWNNDLAEVLAQAQGGLLLSNHSYGVPLESVSTSYLGQYSGEARSWDALERNVPYYLMVVSAGNDGNNDNSNPTTDGYDKLTGNKVAKNNLVVANTQDANVNSSGTLISVGINSSSSRGPADDNRIKPDISGNGSGLYSSVSDSNTSYGTLTGTSMASPNVMGTLILVQQHYNNVNGHFMRASTLKGLACHTADDAGRPGPDATYGWGLLNSKAAAQAITNNGITSWISEETLHQGETFTFLAHSDGTTPLLASICWTDVPGTVITGANSLTPALVNDLDIRVTKLDNVYFPWKLQRPATLNAIRSEDNNVDNVERVNVDSPAGDYVITVTHKATLVDGPQDFAFIVTGLSSSFSLTSLTEQQTACLDGNATYNFHYNNTGSTPITLSAAGLPAGATAVFTPATLTGTGDFSVTISNLQGAATGIYPVSIVGNNGTESEIRTVNLKVSSADLAAVVPTYPADNQNGVALSLSLQWDALDNTDAYRVQVATDASFSTIIATGTVTETQYEVSGLNEDTVYFWRVFPSNQCGEGLSATTLSFHTGQLVCGNHFEPTDYSNGIINSNGSALAILQIPVTGGLTVGDLNVSLDITHTYNGDMTVVLEGPAALGLPRVILFSEPCGDNENIVCTMDDAGADVICNSSIPGISGTVKPYQPLSAFNNLPANGVWTLYVTDPYVGDGGVVNFVGLDFCSIAPALGVASNEETVEFDVYPNPSKGTINIRTSGTSGENSIELYDIEGRKMLSKRSSSAMETINIDHLQNGVYLLSVGNENRKTTKKIILNR